LRLAAGRAHQHARALSSAQPYEDLASTGDLPRYGTWSFVAVIGGLINANRNPIAVSLMVACLGIWTGALVHDMPHPRFAFPPYDWDASQPRSAAGRGFQHIALGCGQEAVSCMNTPLARAPYRCPTTPRDAGQLPGRIRVEFEGWMPSTYQHQTRPAVSVMLASE
jgi:hypothetical protein